MNSKKVLLSLLTMILVIGLCVPAMAAKKQRTIDRSRILSQIPTVVFLPIVHPFPDDEKTSDMMITIFERALQEFKYPKYNLLGDEKFEETLKKLNYFEVAKKGTNEEIMRQVMAETKADIVTMIVIKEIEQSTSFVGGGGDERELLKVNMEMLTIYAADNKKPYRVNVNDTFRQEYAVVHKIDWPLKEVIRITGNYFNRILPNEKK